MKVTVLLFAGLRDRAGASRIAVELPDGASIADAIDAVRAASGREWRVHETVMTALNEEYAERTTALSDGDELALIPPVSGGATSTAPGTVLITDQPLDSEAVARPVRADSDGAVVIFEGVTRNHNEGRAVEYLEYEAYRPMADKKIAGLIDEMHEKFDIDRVSIAHRTGRVEIGEKSMVVAVSAAHRRPAFEAALYFVDRLKEVVPIWKKEHFEGGEVWINDTPG